MYRQHSKLVITADTADVSERSCIAKGFKSPADLTNGGMQCTCIALTYLCFQLFQSRTKKSSYNISKQELWTKYYFTGTIIYNNHISFEFWWAKCLLINELPQIVEILDIPGFFHTSNLTSFGGLIGS